MISGEIELIRIRSLSRKLVRIGLKFFLCYLLTISDQCSCFMPPENPKKTESQTFSGCMNWENWPEMR